MALVVGATSGVGGAIALRLAINGLRVVAVGPARAVVFSYDEKTSCQALDRTQPSLPVTRGRAGTMTHDYKRHGTIDVFAVMNVGTGEVHTHLRKGHADADVLAFFKQIDATTRVG